MKIVEISLPIHTHVDTRLTSRCNDRHLDESQGLSMPRGIRARWREKIDPSTYTCKTIYIRTRAYRSLERPPISANWLSLQNLLFLFTKFLTTISFVFFKVHCAIPLLRRRRKTMQDRNCAYLRVIVLFIVHIHEYRYYV